MASPTQIAARKKFVAMVKAKGKGKKSKTGKVAHSGKMGGGMMPKKTTGMAKKSY